MDTGSEECIYAEYDSQPNPPVRHLSETLSQTEPTHLRAGNSGDELTTEPKKRDLTVEIRRLPSGDSSHSFDATSDTASESREPDTSKSPPSALYTLTKTLRLNLLWAFLAKLSGRTVKEETKIALNESRRGAAIYCVLHVIPMIIALILIHINIAEHFVGYTIPWFPTSANEQLSALQFAAKTHELLMLGSLSATVFVAIRSQLAFGAGLPYGAIFAGLEVGFLNTLWSMEFWAVISSALSKNTRSKPRTWFLVALLTVACILGAAVGPSSANLMIPRWGDWAAGGTTYWMNATADELFPSKIEVTPSLEHCTTRFDDPACPYGGYNIIAESFMSAWANMLQLDNTPETIYLPSQQAERAMTFRDRSQTNGSATIWANAFTLATTSLAAVSDGLSMVGFLWSYAVLHAKDKRQWSKRDNALYSVNTHQPLVMVYCNQYSPADQVEDSTMLFADLSSGGVTMEFDGDHDLIHYNNIKISNFTTLSTAQQFVRQDERPKILWLDDESFRNATTSTLNAIVSIPQSVLGYSSYYCCSIDTRFAEVTITTATHSPKIISGYPLGMESFGTHNPAWKRVYPSPNWAQLIDVDFSPSDGASKQASSPFAELISAAGLWNNPKTVQGAYAPYIVESALASLLANGIARLSYNTSMVGTLRDPDKPANLSKGGAWENELLPNGQMGWGGHAYSISAAEKAHAMMFEMQATASGYGYSTRGTAQILAIVVLLTYVLLSLGNIVYSITSGRYSVSWDTTAEIAELAWNSKRATPMPNTGAGIRTMATFQELVRIEVMADGHLELVRAGHDYRYVREGHAGNSYDIAPNFHYA